MKIHNLEILNADCMDVMKSYKDDYFNLAIVDPPYGIGEDGGNKHRAKPNKAWKNPAPKNYASKEWDKTPPPPEYFIELIRVSKNQIIWGANHFIENIPNANSANWIVWYKAGQNPNTDFSDCELARGSFKKAIKYFKFDWIGFGAVNAKEYRIHPTQKPVALYNWIYSNYSEPGQKIIDTHLGSGSNAIAAHYAQAGAFVGIELDPDYYAAACERIKEQTRQQVLF
tara:strand:+ start:79 stop:759 length:681 start_codon:yes stop_codon:yes gene_type:complete